MKVNIDHNQYSQIRVGTDGALNGFAGAYQSLSSPRHGDAELAGFDHTLSHSCFVPMQEMFGDEAAPDFANSNRARNGARLLGDVDPAGTHDS